MSQEGFIVDTHLLRELGDLLVGRDSTAVIELVKNGYDADATTVTIEAKDLAHPDRAVLSVEDNGNGMTAERFRSAFLRIAGRDKEEGERLSPRFHRAYTGQKGIGRLASQKLASVLQVTSHPDTTVPDNVGPGVEAHIDWDLIDKQDRLDKLSSGLAVQEVAAASGASAGTTLILRSLKRTWTDKDITTFVTELQSAQPPSLLLGSTSEELDIAGEPLIRTPLIRRSDADDPGFSLQLTGELASGDALWAQAAEDFQWLIEISVERGRVQYRVSPTQTYARTEPLARTYSFEGQGAEDITFQARFFMMPNASARRGPLKGFVRSTSGIRVYLEGFRVLPYAEYGDDWLEIDRDYRSGARYYELSLDEAASDNLAIDKKEGLNAVPSNAYYGAVFLTAQGAPNLQSIINREGFVPGPTFTAIRKIVQTGVKLSVRVRRSIYNQRGVLDARGPETPVADVPESPSRPPSVGTPTNDPTGRTPFEVMLPRGPSAADELTIAAAQTAVSAIAEKAVDPDRDVASLIGGFQAAHEALQSLQGVQPELRTLAGVGLQLGAFVHDINGMLAATTTIRELLKALVDQVADRRQRTTLQVVLRTADELAHTLARQSSYLTDVLSTDPRRRRSRVRIADRTGGVLRFLGKRIEDKDLTVHMDVDPDLKTGPMFPAELTIILTNVLTNAVKNAADGGNVWVAGTDHDDVVELVVSNDGAAVDLDESERWFLPFESTTTTVDDVLGQGMGLGLPIVRALVDDYRGDVRFVSPSRGAQTAIRIVLPKKGPSK